MNGATATPMRHIRELSRVDTDDSLVCRPPNMPSAGRALRRNRRLRVVRAGRLQDDGTGLVPPAWSIRTIVPHARHLRRKGSRDGRLGRERSGRCPDHWTRGLRPNMPVLRRLAAAVLIGAIAAGCSSAAQPGWTYAPPPPATPTPAPAASADAASAAPSGAPPAAPSAGPSASSGASAAPSGGSSVTL